MIDKSEIMMRGLYSFNVGEFLMIRNMSFFIKIMFSKFYNRNMIGIYLGFVSIN